MAKPGLPRKYAKMGFKKGWAAYKRAGGGKRKSKRRRVRRPSRPTRRRTTRARRTKTVGKRSGFNPQKMFKYLRLAALFGPAAGIAIRSGTGTEKVADFLKAYTGYNLHNGSFEFARLAEGYMPYLGAVVATYGIPKLAGMIRGL